MHTYIGVDLGTSGVKLILVNKNGRIIRTVTRNYDLIIVKPSWSEQDPNIWYKQTIDGLKELVHGYERQIKGISFSGQMHGLVLLDEFDNVLRNAILWNDQRTVEQVAYLNEVISIESLLEYTGNIALTGLTAPKILWVKENEPEVFKRIKKIMLPKDYLVYKLSGVFASDVSDLSGTLYFNPLTKTYSKEMLEILHIDVSMLPSIHESYERIGLLKTDILNNLNIEADISVIVGGGDQAVGAIGVGVIQDGECSISLGTSGVIFVASDKFVRDEISYFQSYSHANGAYHIMAVMLNAASSIKWWNESILETYNYEDYYLRVASANKKENLLFLPYLTGERAPINDPYAKGVLYGLGVHHQKNDIDRAILEGVTFAIKDSFELIKKLGISIKQVRLTGGGAKSDYWAQLIADILEVKVVKITVEEGPALGAAILAMVGCREYENIQKACESIVQVGKVFIPNLEVIEIYKDKYLEYTKLYPALKNLYKIIP
jgi:xylulokinase